MRSEDAVRIQHMIEAAGAIGSFLAGRKRCDLDADQMLLFALVRAMEVIGEAASKISPDTRSAIPSIAWFQIIAMRNRLVHAYFDIDHDILWRTVTEEIPPLLALLKATKPDDDLPNG